jgi:hypothetical protein
MTLIVIMLVSGAFMLFLGRQLFWFFVMLVGLIIGLTLPSFYSPASGWSQWGSIIAGSIAGVILAVISRWLIKLVGAVIAFLAGVSMYGYLTSIIGWADPAVKSSALLVAIFIGLIAAIVTFVNFDWAILIISSVLGAALITEASVVAFNINPTYALFGSFVLIAIGIIVQVGEMNSRGVEPISGIE